jgi:hypothetical protein
MANRYFIREAARQGGTIHPIMQALKNFVGKLRQNPEIYPIRYYKKSRRFRRTWSGSTVK